jgi:hypothetical protein
MRLSDITVFSETQLLNETLAQMKIIEQENIMNFAFVHWCKKMFGGFSLTELPKEVWRYVSNNFVYQDDEADENLTSPKWLVMTKRGDCDDFSLFIKTVLSVFGIKSNYLLAGKNDEGFSHILIFLPDGTLIDGTNDKFNYLSSEYINREVVL